MSARNILNRRTFLSSAGSLLASGASLMMFPNVYAASQGGAKPGAEGDHHSDDDMQKCIQLCRDCYAMCTQAITHCLKVGGRHAAPDHIRLLLDCAQMCATASDYMLRESPFHNRICRVCSDLCKQCGKDCEQTAADDQMMKQCIEICRKCGDSCERMASKTA
jgi:hypothetical protein